MILIKGVSLFRPNKKPFITFENFIFDIKLKCVGLTPV